MNYDYLFSTYTFSSSKLLEYGFLEEEDSYFYTFSLSHSFSMKIKINKNTFFVKVYDEFQEEYFPIYVKKEKGSFTSLLKEEIDSEIQNILSSCFTSLDLKEKVLSYVKEKYQTIPKYPWEEYSYATLTTKKNKWYGLLMDISYQKLGIDIEEECVVINLKNTPEKIPSLIDNQNIFPAYHMNKKYWITVLLNQKISFSFLTKLIDDSYSLVSKR